MAQRSTPSPGLLLNSCEGSLDFPGLLLAQTFDRLEQFGLRSLLEALGLLAGLGQEPLSLLAGLFEPTIQLLLMLAEPHQGLRLTVR